MWLVTVDWIPLSTGSVRPTQGRTLAFAQVNGGSQSFNTVNTLRILGRWMRMFVIPNQVRPGSFLHAPLSYHGLTPPVVTSPRMEILHPGRPPDSLLQPGSSS